MPGQGKYTTYQPVKTDAAAKGQSSSKLLNKLFNPPAEITDVKNIIDTANKYLLATETNGLQFGDGQQFIGGVSLNYAEAPDLLTVGVGGGGLPSTPFTPNLTSPGPTNGVSPNGQVDMEIKDISDLNGQAQLNVNGLKNPQKESALIGTSVVLSTDKNSLTPGAHPGGEGIKLA